VPRAWPVACAGEKLIPPSSGGRHAPTSTAYAPTVRILLWWLKRLRGTGNATRSAAAIRR
jgi:hypothetical protein